MTKSELKDIIKECLYENDILSLESLIERFDYETDKFEESMLYELELEYINEGANINNIKSARKAIKSARNSLKQSKILLKDNDKSGAIKELDNAINNLLEVKKSIIYNQGGIVSRISSGVVKELILSIPTKIISFIASSILLDKNIPKEKKVGLGKLLTNIIKIIISRKTTNKIDNIKKEIKDNKTTVAIDIGSKIPSEIIGHELKSMLKQYKFINGLDKANYSNMIIDGFIDSMIDTIKKEKEYISKNF